VIRDGNLLRLPGHEIRLRGEEQTLADKIKALLRKSRFAPPDLKQIESDIGIGQARLREVIRLMEREKSIIRVAIDMYFLTDSVDEMKRSLREHFSKETQITPASVRDLFGTSRKYTIPLLEFFDREGITVRAGDTRRLRA